MGKIIFLPILLFLGTVIALLPPSIRLKVGSGLGTILFKIGYRYNIVIKNLELFLPLEKDSVLRKDLARKAYNHIGNVFIELLLPFGPFKWFVSRYASIQGIEHWQNAQKLERGVLFLSSHLGNWEIMSACGALHGMPLMLVTKHLKPEWFHKAFEKGRAKCGVSGAYEPSTMRDVLGHLGKAKTVGIVLDQYAGPPVGIRVPFFGVPVGTHTLIAMMAKRKKIPVVPVFSRRTLEGKYVVEMFAPVAWIENENPSLEIALNTANYSSIIESHIRLYPDQWLWTHRRFKGDLSPLIDSEWSEKRVRNGETSKP